MSFKIPSATEINKMTNATLKVTLTNLIEKIGETEQGAAVSEDAGDGPATAANTDTVTNKLLEQILTEVKKFNTEKEAVRVELQELKATNELLLDAVTQQQRFLEELDTDRRSKNLIVLGIPEGNMTVNQVTASTDSEKVNLVFGAMGCENLDVNSTQRLGKISPGNDRARPVKVGLSSPEQRQNAVTAGLKLAESSNHVLKEIKVKKDVHPAIRKEFGRLFELERTEKAKPENTGKEVVFDKRRRVLMVNGQVIDRYKPAFF